MSKRGHREMANDAESGLAPAKRISPLNAGTSDAEASKHLDTLSEYLGIRDLTVEDSSQGLLATPFIDPELAAGLSDTQKQMLVEAVTSSTARLAALMAKASRSQGTVMALRDLQVNWNLPDDRRWSEMGAWKSVSKHTNQTLSRVAADLKKLKRKQQQEAQAPKELSTVSLSELFNNISNKTAH